MSNANDGDKPNLKTSALNRRNMLLASTTLAAASALGTAASVQKAVAQAQQAAPAGQKPNILVIMGDDVGWFNIGAYHQGIMSGQDAEPRQARRRRHALHRLLRRSELHRRPRQLHHRANSAAHRPDHGRPGRRRRRHAGTVGDDGASPEIDGLRHRPVRQEPSRRLEQVSADGARLRRILRLSLSPRRDVRSVLVRLSAGLDRQIRPAQPGAFLRDRHRRSDRDAALGQGRQAAHRRRRPAQAVQGYERGSPDVAEGPRRQIRHGDLRRSSGRADQGLHGSRPSRPTSRSSSGTTPRACTSSPTCSRSTRRR